MLNDPPPNADGTCAIDGCRGIVPPRGREDGDPFCSNMCCHEWHGVILASSTERSDRAPRAYTSGKPPTAPT